MEIDIQTASGEFIVILILSLGLVAVRFLKKMNEELEHQGNLIEWMAIIFMPVSLSFAAFKEWNIPPDISYWAYLGGMMIWIGIGIHHASHNKQGWSFHYSLLFGTFLTVLIIIGILLGIFAGIFYMSRMGI